MNKTIVRVLVLLTIILLTSACIRRPYTCDDPSSCVTIGNKESIKIGVLLTLSGPNASYGIDALRGVELAIADKGQVFGHNIELVQQDDLCSKQGGIDGANALAADPKIVAVIGATCSSSTEPAAKILSEKNLVLISPSSTAPSLTDPKTHQPGFLRTIYNDKAQGKTVAEFAFKILGARTMVTVHDGTPYPLQLQQAACDYFKQLGGQCLIQIQIQSGQDMTGIVKQIADLAPDVLYYPLYTADGVNLTQKIVTEPQLFRTALISSDGLLSNDFLKQTGRISDGMYLSGPATIQEPQAFLQKYLNRYGEQPIASYHLQAYDAAYMLFEAIEHVAHPSSRDGIIIPRQALRQALFAVRQMNGLSGTITCSPSGDCAVPNITIFQVKGNQFLPIYP
ncbi:MAG: branched-chain amino acid ABC transporter substrate-binding protein [Anaerolineae bacterium]